MEDKDNSRSQEASVAVNAMEEVVAVDSTTAVVHSREVIHLQLRHPDSAMQDLMEQVHHTQMARMVQHPTLDSLKKLILAITAF